MIRRRMMRLYRGEFFDILKAVITGRVARGEYIEKFEKEFARYVGTKYALATCTGRNGMELLLEALGLKEGDEVILPAYTLKDLVLVIKGRGLVPVIVDIEEDTYNIDPERAEKAITERTRVIIATHIFGSPCNIERLIAIARLHHLAVIEDCAHATGAEYKGRRMGSFGKAAFFSLETIKPVNTFGGGMVTTDDDEVAGYLRGKINGYPYQGRKIVFKIIYSYFEHIILHSPLYLLIALLFRSEFFTKIISALYLFIHKKARIERFHYSNLQALMGLRQLKELDKRNAMRVEKANNLIGLFREDIAVQRAIPQARPIYYFFVIKTSRHFRELRKKLLCNGIDVGTGSEITDDCSKILGSYCCPAAGRVYSQAIQIPFYDGLKTNQIVNIARVINEL